MTFLLALVYILISIPIGIICFLVIYSIYACFSNSYRFHKREKNFLVKVNSLPEYNTVLVNDSDDLPNIHVH